MEQQQTIKIIERLFSRRQNSIHLGVIYSNPDVFVVGDLPYFVTINYYILACFWTFIGIILIGTVFIYFTNSQNSKIVGK